MNKTIKAPTTDVEQIIQFLQQEQGGSLVLSKSQEEALERYNFADNLLRSYNTPSKVANMMMIKFSYSKASAYRDLSASQKIFASVSRIQKEYWRKIMIDQIMDTVNLARGAKDLKALNMAQANLIKVLGIDKIDPEMPDWEIYQQHVYNIDLPPEIIEVLMNIVGKGVFDLNTLRSTLDITKMQIPPADGTETAQV